MLGSKLNESSVLEAKSNPGSLILAQGSPVICSVSTDLIVFGGSYFGCLAMRANISVAHGLPSVSMFLGQSWANLRYSEVALNHPIELHPLNASQVPPGSAVVAAQRH